LSGILHEATTKSYYVLTLGYFIMSQEL